MLMAFIRVQPKTVTPAPKSKDLHAGSLGTNCSSCHSTSGWPTTTINHTTQTAFPLTGKHTTVGCASCHVNGVYKGTTKDCYTCHKAKDAHLGSLGTTCSECHTTTGWTPATYTRSHTFPIKHQGISTCGTCHPNTPSNFLTYTCYTSSCHRGDHHTGNYVKCVQCHANGREP